MNIRQNHAPSSARRCIECDEPLSKHAKRCLKCDSYQNSWKRKLQFIGAVAGSLTLIGGALVYVFNLLPTLRKQFHWRTDVHIVAFDTSHGLTLLNAGDGPVLLINMSLEIEGIGTQSISINKRLDSDQIIQYDFPRHGTIDRPAVLLAHVSPPEWRSAVAIARSSDDSVCIFPIAFADIDPSYAVYAEAGRRDPHHFPTLHASAVLHYF